MPSSSIDIDAAGSFGSSAAEAVEERCRALVPMLRESGLENEKRRGLGPEVLEALRDAGAFRMAIPKQWEGLSLMPSEQARIVTAIACGDGAAAWCVQISAVAALIASRANLRAQAEIFGGNRGPTAAGKAEPLPGCVAREVDEGWMIKGRWNFASTLDNAQWVFGGALFEKRDQSKFPGVFFMPKRHEWVVDDWHVMGLAASASASFEFRKDVFVPTYRCMPLSGLSTAPAYSAEEPFFAADPVTFAQTLALANAFGCYTAAWTIWNEIARKRRQPHPDFALQAENPVTHMKAGGHAAFSALVQTVLDRFGTLADAQASGKHEPTPSDALENSALFGQIMFDIADRTVDIMRDSGAGTIYLSHPMQRAVRDVIVSNMHAGANRDRHFEALGRHLYGLSPLVRIDELSQAEPQNSGGADFAGLPT